MSQKATLKINQETQKVRNSWKIKLDSNIGHGFKVHVHVHGRFDMDTILVWIMMRWGYRLCQRLC